MSEKIKKALRMAVNVGCGFEGDAEDAASLLSLIETNEARIARLEAERKKAFDLVRKLRMYCIYANWDNPDTEDEFNEFDAEVCEYLSEYKVCVDQLTAHSDIERQDDKCSGHGDISNFPPVMGSGDGLGW